MSEEETPKDESGGLSNEPLPGSGGSPSPQEPPSGTGDEPTRPMPPAPSEGGATPPPPPPPPAPAAPAAGTPGAPVAASGAAPVAAGPTTPGQPGLAIAAFVCGLISVFTSWCCIGIPLGIAAVVCGALAKGEVERRGAPSWMWITGLVLGIISLAVFAILLILGAANTDWNFDTSTT